MNSASKITRLVLIVLLFLYATQNGYSQNYDKQERGDLRLLFYNVENLFDTYDDSNKEDDEFLPDGEKHWTYNRYQDKLKNLFKVIIAVGGWKPPEIIGLSEVENKVVLEDLLKNTPLSKFEYKIEHYESPDVRGIDVALLYLSSSFTILNSKTVPITFTGEPEWETRDILYVKGVTADHDTLHLFINHWPSRTGGQLETEKYRLVTASVLYSEVEQIFTLDPNAKIIMMGDFNDNPNNRSIRDVLKVKLDYPPVDNSSLYNLSHTDDDPNLPGTIKYKMEWGLFDQIIVSGCLLKGNGGVRVQKKDFHAYSAEYLMEPDATYLGMKPFRTYIGYKYQNGFSDHLPVYIDLWKSYEE